MGWDRLVSQLLCLLLVILMTTRCGKIGTLDPSAVQQSQNEGGSQGSQNSNGGSGSTSGTGGGTGSPNPSPAAAPTLTSLSPASGALVGGTTITLAGTGFQTAATVTLGSTACGTVDVVSATQITCVTAAGVGQVNVTVTNPDTQSATLLNTYVFGTPDSWVATSTVNVAVRFAHTAVWTGSKMVVWGGGPGFVNTGDQYDPVADSWTPTSTVGAPPARAFHQAVWTGNKMIIWGGQSETAVDLNTGGQYDPVADTWTAISTTGAPLLENGFYSVVWTGSKMIVWGGALGGGNLLAPKFVNTGALYDPVADSWTPTSIVNAPSARGNTAAVWTGTKMLVWGGITAETINGNTGVGTLTYTNTGGLYDPVANSWMSTSIVNAPSARLPLFALSIGKEVIIWGGQESSTPALTTTSSVLTYTGSRYDPVADSWTPMSTTNAPSISNEYWVHPAVWTGTKMILWGGYNGSSITNTGAQYDPVVDTWVATSTVDAPAAVVGASLVWDGNRMIVFGGEGTVVANAGGLYTP